MASRHRRYQYQALDTSKRQIRLLQVRKGQIPPASHPVDLCINLSIETFNIDEAPPYAALSYTWGPEKPTYNLVIDGGVLEVRENLILFFKELSRLADVSWSNWKTTTNYIWIDQICINQPNMPERNHQVRLMSRIYRYSEMVVVWLGNPSPEFRKAARGFKGMQGIMTGRRKRAGFEPLSVLLRDEYFTRLWIVQEVLLSGHVTVMFHGGVTVYWPDVYKVAAQNPRRFERAGLSLDLLSMLESSGMTHYKSLKWCIDRFSGQQCHEPRDKVYGLLGLVRKQEQVKVDYGKSIQKVFLDVVRVLHSAYRAESHRRSPERAVYWFRSVAHDYRTTLETLARRMGFEQWDCGLVGTRTFLHDVFGHRRLKRPGSEPDEYPTKKNIGFKSARSKSAHLRAGRWWRKANDERFFYDCRPCSTR